MTDNYKTDLISDDLDVSCILSGLYTNWIWTTVCVTHPCECSCSQKSPVTLNHFIFQHLISNSWGSSHTCTNLSIWAALKTTSKSVLSSSAAFSAMTAASSNWDCSTKNWPERDQKKNLEKGFIGCSSAMTRINNYTRLCM